MTTEPIHYQSITEISDRLRRRDISPVELVEDMLKRIAEVDGRLNSYYTVTADLAREQAHRAEAEISAGRYWGPLHGVPFGLKDLFFTEGILTTAGMPLHKAFKPSFNAAVVERLYQAGAVLLGKHRLTEGACIEHHPDLGTPVNPWRSDLWTGASSSGSAVATAAGLCFASIGSDTGGSIRFPCGPNNLTGVKPTWGRVSRYGIWDLAPSYDHLGPITRSAEDAAIVLGAIAGADARDPTSLLSDVPDYARQLRGVNGCRGLSIGIDETYSYGGTDDEVVSLLNDVRATFASLGAELTEARFPDPEPMIRHMPAVHMAELAHSHRSTYPLHKEAYGKWITAGLANGTELDPVDFAHTMVERDKFKGSLGRMFESIDALLIPVFGFKSPTWYEFETIADKNIIKLFKFTLPFNASGNPSVVFPCGFTRDGRPVGAQLVGPHLSEARLLRAVHAYQLVTDWHLNRPIA